MAWVKELVSVHGRDVEEMVKDRKRNVWQKTAGQIRRRWEFSFFSLAIVVVLTAYNPTSSINKAGGFEACGAL